ncbi:MAG: endonuclease/exonuclease/phosphatase family protein [Chloroflexota bacterium]
MSTQYSLAFWNLENFFDIEDSARRSEKLQRAIGKDIKGWTQALVDRKTSQLASIIQQMNSGRGPDLLGVCEVENAFVLDLLVQALAPLGRHYAVEHHDMSDQRGIDVGFIYDADLFSVEAQFSHVVMRRTATRDILQVNFRTRQNRLFVIVGNHWPSRSGGALESACYRAIAGETLTYFHQRILEVHGKDTPVLAMGDFNDEPFDRSLVDFTLSLRSRTKVSNARNACFLNLMWPLMGQGLGSLYFDRVPNMLDQFLANKNLLKHDAVLHILPETAALVRFPEMIATGEYPEPVRFGGMGKPVNQDGFSDHFPVTVQVVETD